MAQIKNYCAYYGRPIELRPDYLDRVVKSYFTAMTPAVAIVNRVTNVTNVRNTQLRCEHRNPVPDLGSESPVHGAMTGSAK